MTRTITIEEPLAPCHDVLLPINNFGVLVSKVLLHGAVDAGLIPAVEVWAKAASTSCDGQVLLAVGIVGCFRIRVSLPRHIQLQRCSCSGIFVFLQSNKGDPFDME